MHICICICTFKRPLMLETLLHSLQNLHTGGQFSYSLVVADNDRERSAERTVARVAAVSRIDIRYCVEPEQNIAKARNRALANATGEFIAMIDDDEIPGPEWLLHAWRHCIAAGVDGVLGPVRPRFDHQPPAWVVKSRLFERPEPPTGHRVTWREARTGNVLLRHELVAGDPEPFDIAFAVGSEDKDFFKRMMQRGATFEWCNEAAVHEVVPPDRCRRSYVIKRALLRGQNERAFTSLRGIAKSCLAVPAYMLLLPLVFLFGQHHFMRYLVRLCDHVGKLLMLVRIRPIHTYVS